MCYRPVYLWGCFVAMFLIVPAFSMAQEVLTLAQAIEEAQAKNPDLEIERQRLKIVQANRVQAGLLLPFNPEIEYERASDRLFENRGSTSYGIALSQEIEIAGQRGKRKRIANMMIEQIQAEIVQSEQTVIAQVKTAYHRLAFHKAQLQVMQTILTFKKRMAVAAERRYQTGDISEIEYNLVLTEYHQAVAETERFQAEIQASEIALNLLLGRAIEQPVQVQIDTLFTPVVMTLSDLQQQALDGHPELKAMGFDKQVTEKEIGLAIAEAIPNPKLLFSYEKDQTVFAADDFIGDPAIISGIGSLRDNDRLFRFQISLPLPLMNRNQAGIQMARAKDSVNQARLAGLTQRINSDVTKAYYVFVGAQDALKAYQILIPQTDQSAELLLKAYDMGELDLTAMLVQTDRFFRIRLAYFETLFFYHQALANLELSVGGSSLDQ